MRGEHFVEAGDANREGESSPHARGARDATELGEHLAGIIPACAGSTCYRGSHRRTRRDHPRMRGEHRMIPGTSLGEMGSSPHARGALVEELVVVGRHGIIPACAGSTPSCTGASRPRRDHPRMRGEHSARRRCSSRSRGSSPHARGAPAPVDANLGGRGIIPACAGSTHRPRAGNFAPQDHPRMRGEHPQLGQYRKSSAGSSPHARGARRHLRGLSRRRGIIPACAGSTRQARRSRPGSGDHPRMRGEHYPVR